MPLAPPSGRSCLLQKGRDSPEWPAGVTGLVFPEGLSSLRLLFLRSSPFCVCREDIEVSASSLQGLLHLATSVRDTISLFALCARREDIEDPACSLQVLPQLAATTVISCCAFFLQGGH